MSGTSLKQLERTCNTFAKASLAVNAPGMNHHPMQMAGKQDVALAESRREPAEPMSAASGSTNPKSFRDPDHRLEEKSGSDQHAVTSGLLGKGE